MKNNRQNNKNSAPKVSDTLAKRSKVHVVLTVLLILSFPVVVVLCVALVVLSFNVSPFTSIVFSVFYWVPAGIIGRQKFLEYRGKKVNRWKYYRGIFTYLIPVSVGYTLGLGLYASMVLRFYELPFVTIACVVIVTIIIYSTISGITKK